ncbi:MAG: glutamine--fructose-6-phosphate transaminase (isomerizing) [Thaumarchaeota archaeon]|nr:glutamine--fructose-6-phosphate transaminase (isomerizing) [Nitrososphaerota archaeon]
MCGIIAGISGEEIAPILVEGLKRVEYRGYDSAGIATVHDGEIEVRKDVGRVAELDADEDISSMPGKTGMAHTRWATHGGVTKANAHPHLSCDGEVAVIHNGIIENYLELKEDLLKGGHVFKSETDTEVVAHLVEDAYRKFGDPMKAALSGIKAVKGQYAFVFMFRDHPDVLIGTRDDAPLVIGAGARERFLASDVLAFIARTDRAVFLENKEVAELTPKGFRVFNARGVEVKKKPTQLAWELSDVSKLNYAHYTLKEIHEQPETIVRAMMQEPEKLAAFVKAIRGAKSVLLTASGSSYHAALLLKSRLSREARIRCDVVIAGEFEEQAHFVDKGTVMVVFSQSGETADLLNAIKAGRQEGAKVLAVVNAAGSSLARESDVVLLLNCGPEVGVAATKSFTAQVMVSNMIADALIGRNTIGDSKRVSALVRQTLRSEEAIQRVAKELSGRTDFYFIARGAHYAIAQEGALKLKELSYVHAEGMPASELKHGTLALIEKGTPVVVIAHRGEGFASTISNAMELQARGAEIIGISDKEHPVFKHFISIPETSDSVAPILEVIPLQLLAYFMATERKNDPDYPRNLAKSVTVR